MADAEKVAILYDHYNEGAGENRAERITEALQREGYSVKQFDRIEARKMASLLSTLKPDLFVTSSMGGGQFSGGIMMQEASIRNVPSVMFTGRPGTTDNDWFKEIQEAGFPASVYEYSTPEMDMDAFMEVVHETVAMAEQAEVRRRSAIDPAKVAASRPAEWAQGSKK